MRCLVTGANGLLGANLCRALLAAGHEVRALVRAGSNREGLAGLSLTLVEGDVRDAASLRAACDGMELVFHGAAVFAYAGFSKEEMYSTAEAGARNTVDAARDAKVKRLILTSTCALLGGSTTPTSLDETSTPDLSAAPDYFLSKDLQERTTFARGREVGLEVIAANPSLFVGPYDFRPSQSLATVTTYITAPLSVSITGGSNVVDARDVAAGHLLLAERGTPFERHILSGEDLTWTQFYNLCSELVGLPPPRFTAGRGLSYVSAAAMELGSLFTGKPPLANRALAKQTGRYFWYRHDKASRLGFSPRPTRDLLVDLLGWLLTSRHLSDAQKRRLTPVPDVRAAAERFRQGMPVC